MSNSSKILWTVAHWTPPSMGFSGPEYWSGLPCLPPGDLPDSGIELMSPEAPALQVDSLLPSHQGSQVIKQVFSNFPNGVYQAMFSLLRSPQKWSVSARPNSQQLKTVICETSFESLLCPRHVSLPSTPSPPQGSQLWLSPPFYSSKAPWA